ncbi:MAG: LysM peptidoglycan-binding domain-containing protein [Actinomyces sp.]|nr:MAG: LysM peptidoglycan-binding domain-containing protein [Actinomyces sp.]
MPVRVPPVGARDPRGPGGAVRPLAVLAALAAAASAATGVVHVVPGDTLSEIAAREGVTVAELVAWNGIADPDLIYAGDTLRLEPSAPGTGGVAGVEAEAGQAGEESVRHHLISAGETLSTIARRYAVSIAELVAWNGIADPDLIYAGDTLVIGGEPLPATPTSTAPTTTTSTTLPTPTTTLPSPTTSAGPDPTREAPAASVEVPPPGASGVLTPLIERWSDAYGVPADLLAAIAWYESRWRPDAVGPGGHLGMGQLSPDTVAFVERNLLGLDLDPLDPSDGTRLAARYLRFLLDRTPDERHATAAWVQGLGSVQRRGITPAGEAYVEAVETIRRSLTASR